MGQHVTLSNPFIPYLVLVFHKLDWLGKKKGCEIAKPVPSKERVECKLLLIVKCQEMGVKKERLNKEN